MWLGLPFESIDVDTPEDLDTPLASDPPALASHLAAEKALAARDRGLAGDALVLAFDTIVVHEGKVLGKPADAADARRMLRSLSGRIHQVVTGVAILCPDDDAPRTFSEVSDVRMRELSDARIEEWMSSGEYLGCAGAYNIESQVADVEGSGCFQNVAGLPLCRLYSELAGSHSPRCLEGVPLSPVPACESALGRSCSLGEDLTRR